MNEEAPPPTELSILQTQMNQTTNEVKTIYFNSFKLCSYEHGSHVMIAIGEREKKKINYHQPEPVQFRNLFVLSC
jgi:hypothetical protein